MVGKNISIVWEMATETEFQKLFLSLWQKINGIWYYFNESGYMASEEYYNGYWFNADGCWYYFDSEGYMVTSQYIDGYWIDADGVCR